MIPAVLVAPLETLTTTSGVRDAVRTICSSWAGEKRTRPAGPRRAKLRRSSSGSSRPTLVTLFGMSDVPADKIRLDERTDTVAQRFADPEHGQSGHRTLEASATRYKLNLPIG